MWAARWAAAAVAGSLILGCREAPTPTGPTPRGPGISPPSVVTHPGRDTTVDPAGLLDIEVIARDAARIDTINLLISGASITFPATSVRDTAIDLLYRIPLAAVGHQGFSFRVAAGDVLGHDTVTDIVTVRLR